MKYNLNDAISILERTPEVLSSLLRNLPENWTSQNEGGNTWSPFDVVGHLIHGEKTDWIIRTEIILKQEDKTFEPFDRFAQLKESEGKNLNELLDEFSMLRTSNLEQLKAFNVSESQLDLKGTHPELGEVTLRNMLSTWVSHDLGHIAQISRVMAKQYQEEVGVWHQYLGILHT